MNYEEPLVCLLWKANSLATSNRKLIIQKKNDNLVDSDSKNRIITHRINRIITPKINIVWNDWQIFSFLW